MGKEAWRGHALGSFRRLLTVPTPRHGWGIPQDAALAVTYLSQAASNSAGVESQALAAGMKKGGAAKGELVLAMYELANSFRHGWGVEKDPVAARSYYETAANLGDTDAMNEVARCYAEGFGGKKDKVSGLDRGASHSGRRTWEAWARRRFLHRKKLFGSKTSRRSMFGCDCVGQQCAGTKANLFSHESFA